ncbi:hypothetical protein LKI_04575 [Leuconostoc kimchii IMSNU 11154]|uniref:Uncharacterized protein n=1 Tax=Leuconostoc kimchii (strain IMSNU 11154 / KCTC 2386 / IH25) TaxID=762051 RepID=D5T2F8_LEUKI|nr:hypothetical protein [Leuconostoc kimchii]ADG40457.1 hypothetical protein LKI_04575 [Leuconostoc kimchii IMSNU 11154]
MTTFDFEKNIAVLQDAKGKEIEWRGSHYPAYSTGILVFAQSYFKSDAYDRYFDRTLRQYGFREGIPEVKVAEIAKKSDNYDLVRALMSAVIRGEKYTSGMWQVLVYNGIMLDLLVRQYQLKTNIQLAIDV